MQPRPGAIQDSLPDDPAKSHAPLGLADAKLDHGMRDGQRSAQAQGNKGPSAQHFPARRVEPCKETHETTKRSKGGDEGLVPAPHSGPVAVSVPECDVDARD